MWCIAPLNLEPTTCNLELMLSNSTPLTTNRGLLDWVKEKVEGLRGKGKKELVAEV